MKRYLVISYDCSLKDWVCERMLLAPSGVKSYLKDLECAGFGSPYEVPLEVA